MSSAGWATLFTGVLIFVAVIVAWVACIRRFPLDDAPGPWRTPDPVPRHVHPDWMRARQLQSRLSAIQSNRQSWEAESERIAAIKSAVIADHESSIVGRGSYGLGGRADDGERLPPPPERRPKRFSDDWMSTKLSEIEGALDLSPPQPKPVIRSKLRRSSHAGAQDLQEFYQ